MLNIGKVNVAGIYYVSGAKTVIFGVFVYESCILKVR